MSSATEQLAFEKYCRLLPCDTRSYLVISARTEYFTFDQDGNQNIVSMKQLSSVKNEGRSDSNVTSDTRESGDINLAKETSSEEKKN